VAQVLLSTPDVKAVKKTFPSLSSLIPGTVLLLVLLLAQKLWALLAS